MHRLRAMLSRLGLSPTGRSWTVLSLIAEAVQHYGINRGSSFAGNMAFYGMLSFFPFLIFLVAVSGYIGQSEAGQEAIRVILESMPPDVAETIRRPIEGIIRNTHGEVLTASIVFALWSAASGIEAARAAVTRAYGEEFKRAIWKRRIESLLIVASMAILAISGMSLLVAGPALLKLADAYVALPEGVLETWKLLQYAVAPAALLIALWGLYLALSPRKHFRRQFNLPGAMFTLLVWMATAAGFSTYLKFSSNLDVTYGSLAGVLIAQIFFYVVSIGFILGAEINAAISRHYQADHPNEGQQV